MVLPRNYPVMVEVGWDNEPKRLVTMLDYPPGSKCECCGMSLKRLDRGYCIQWICAHGSMY